MKRASLIAIMIVFSTICRAEISVNQYEGARKHWKRGDVLETQVSGMIIGLGWANAELVDRKEIPLYCQPGKLALTAENALDLLDEFLKRPSLQSPEARQLPYGTVLLAALQDAFPCKN